MRNSKRLFAETVEVLGSWEPERWYRSERRFQDDLQDYLADILNQHYREEIIVEKEHGRYNVDVCVADSVGIELKRKLDTTKMKRLNGQIQDYVKSYDSVIVVTCGIDQKSAWSKTKKRWLEEFNPNRGETGQIVFIHVPANGEPEIDMPPRAQAATGGGLGQMSSELGWAEGQGGVFSEGTILGDKNSGSPSNNRSRNGSPETAEFDEVAENFQELPWQLQLLALLIALAVFIYVVFF